MSFRGRGGRGRGGGRGGFRGRGGGRGGYQQDMGPPESVVGVGQCVHPCEGDLVCKGIIEKVPYFNAPIYLENKSQIGKVDEIFGPMNDYYFSVKLLPNMQANSFNKEQKFFIDPMKLLPLMRFLPKPKGTPGSVQKRGGGRGGFRGRGGFGGRGRGGGGRGGFTPRGRGGFTSRGRGRGGGGGGFSSGRGRGFRGRR